MAEAKKLVILRKNKPNINKVIGDVIASLPHEQFEGVEVKKVGENFVRVTVADLDENLEEALLNGNLRLRSPDLSDPFYIELLTTGFITTDNATLLDYVEVVDA